MDIYNGENTNNEYYTIIVTVVAPSAPTAALTSLTPSAIVAGGTSTAVVTLTNPNGTAPLAGIADSITLPSGVTIAAVPNASTTCTSGSVTATAGSGSVSLSGGSLTASGTCTFTFNITAASASGSPYTISSGTPSATGANAGTAGSTAALTVTLPPAPTVTSLVPTSGPTSGTNVIVVTGTNFSGVTSVFFGGTPATSFTFNSATQISATAPAHSAGTVDVTVTTGGGTSATSAADQYIYVAAPTVTSISPTTGPVAGGTSVIITGTGFATAPSTGAVKFGATVATYTINSATQITATAPAGTGTVDIRVTTTGGASATSGADQYTYAAAPTVSSISPTAGATAGGTTVTLTGTGFTGVTAVTFGATPATGFTFNSATSITATAPAGTGTVDIRVTTAGGTSATSGADQFTFVTAPTVTAISPTSGLTVGGTSVVITGTGFAAAPSTGAVKFGVATATYTINGNTQITATAPAGSAGTVDVTVATSGGTSATGGADQFTYIAAPTITATSPTAGPSTGGTTVTISGTGFTGVTAITFGATPATGFTFNSATSVTATAPAGIGTIDIRVTTPGGISLTSGSDQFTYVTAPAVNSISPANGPAAGGTTVTLTGTGFTGVTAITFGATPASSFTFVNATTITATAPAGTGTVDIRVTTTGGTSATGAGDRYSYVPALTATQSVPAVSGTVGVALASTTPVTASGGTGTISYALSGATLPNGLTFATTTGALTGTPTAALAATTFTVTATDQTTPTAQTASKTFTLTIAKGPQTITFGALSDASLSASPLTLAATSSSGLAVTFISATTAVCTVSGTSLTLLTTGTCTVDADQAGDTNYDAASQVQRSFTVTPATLAVTPGAATGTIVGGSYSQANPASGGTAPYSFALASGTLPAGTNLNTTTGTVTGTSTTAGAFSYAIKATDSQGTPVMAIGATVSGTIAKGAQTITFTSTAPAGAQVGGTYIPTATATSGLAVTLTIDPASAAVCTLSGGTVSFMATGTCTVNADQAGDANYNAASRSQQNITVSETAPTAAAASANVAYNTAKPIDLSGSITGVHTSIAIGTAPTHGTTSIAGDVVTYTPTSGYFGADSFTYTATGPGGTSAPATVTLTVATPAAPTTAAASANVAYNTAKPIDLSGSITGVHTSIAIGTAPTHGTTSIAGDVVTYTPTTGYFGPDSFTYTATGPGGTSAPATVTLTVATPAAPTAAAASANVGYNTAKPIDLSGWITGVHTSIAIGTAPAHGTTSIAGDVVTYTPATGYFGADSFTYTATGPGGTSAPATVTLTVATPAAPTVAAASANVAYNTAKPIDLSGSITGVHTSIAIGTAPAHGTTSIAGDVVTYTPATGYFGADSFTYTATGPGGTSAPATVTLTVATPAAPTAAAASANVAYNTAKPIDLSGSITGVHTSIAIGTAPAHGTTSIAGDVVTYTPATGYFGADSFTYTATGPGGTSAPATVSLTVATPAAPTAAAASTNVSYDTAKPIDLSASITGVHTSIAIGAAPTHGTTSIAGDVVTYTPATGYFGADSFAYTATGPGGTSAPATVTLTVATPALAITPTSLPAGRQDAAYSVTLSTSGGAAPYSYAVTGGALPAGLSLTTTGTISGTPTTNGTFGVTITATDSSTGTGPAHASQVYSLQIAVPAPPTAHDGSATVSESVTGNQSVAIDLTPLVSGNVTDVQIDTGPQHGTVTIGHSSGTTALSLGASATGTRYIATYTPTAGYQGPDRFTFVAVGLGGTSAPAVISITVVGIVPVAANVVATTGQNVPVTVDVTGGAAGGPFTQAAIVGVSPAGSATATLIEGGTAASRTYRVLVTPSARFSGTTVVTYTLGNAFGMSTPATVTVTVTGRPDPSADPIVRGLVDAQDTATRDFARTQLDNFNRRNEQLHGGGGTSNPIGLTLSSPDGSSGWSRGGNNDGNGVEAALKMEHANAVFGNERASLSRAGGIAPGGGFAAGAIQMSGTPVGTAAGSSGTAAATGRTVRDGNGTGGGDIDAATGERKIGSVAVWSGGAIDVGTRDATTRRAKLSLSSSGLSAGADVKLTDGLTIGAGGGVGEERTKIGTNDAGHLTADNWVAALYGSLTPIEGAFIDGVVGYGDLNFDTRRAAIGGTTAVGHRDGSIVFGSLSAGIDRTSGAVNFSAYGRAEYLSARLANFAESGAGVYDLTFDRRTLESLTGVLGGRAAIHLGSVTPRARFEWRHEFNRASDQLLDYADLGGPSAYRIADNDWLRDEFQTEVGFGLDLGSGWQSGFDLGGRIGQGSRAATGRISISKHF